MRERKIEYYRIDRYKQFMNQILQACQQTDLYRAGLRKNLGELKGSTLHFNIEVPYYKKYGEGLYSPKQSLSSLALSLLFIFAYEGNQEIVTFLLQHDFGKIKDAIQGYAEAGHHHTYLKSLLKTYPECLTDAMRGYMISGRMLELADLIACSGSADIPAQFFKPRDLPAEGGERIEIIRLLMFIQDDYLRNQVIEKSLKNSLYASFGRYDINDLYSMEEAAKKRRDLLPKLFTLLLKITPLYKESIWLVVSYIQPIQPEECEPLYSQFPEYKHALSTRPPLLAWLTQYCQPASSMASQSICTIS